MALISLHNGSLNLGGLQLLDGAHLQIHRGARIGLVGRNGAGKSTLLKVIAGDLPLDSGKLKRLPGTRISRLIQDVPEGETRSSFAVVADGLGQAGNKLGEYFELSLKLDSGDSKTVKRFNDLQQWLTEHDQWRLQGSIEKTLSRLDLTPEANFSTLSSGLKRRVLLAQAFVVSPDLLLLDEPTNHMDIPAIETLENLLKRENLTLLFTTHDRSFLARIASQIVDLDRGQLRSYEGNYQKYLERKTAELDVEVQKWQAFDNKLAGEEAWLRRGVKARRTRNMGRVRELKKMREARRARKTQLGQSKLNIQEAERSGALVAKIDTLQFHYPETKIVENLSTLIMRGDRVGILGPNGVGKSTLVKLILGQLHPEGGRVKLGTNLEIAYFDQLRESLDDSCSVAENVNPDGGDFVTVAGQKRHVMSYLQDFLFSPERVRRPISNLSGGERHRLLLARLFTKSCNVLVLDEPTNDLDVETLELLEEQLINFRGTILLVSHDRAFLNNVVTSTLAWMKPGTWHESHGGYDDFVRQRPKPVKKQKVKAQLNEVRAKKRQLSGKEKRELEGLPGQIERLEERQAELSAKMSEPSFFKNHREQVAGASEEIESLQRELEKAYSRWERLEEIAGQ